MTFHAWDQSHDSLIVHMIAIPMIARILMMQESDARQVK